MAEQEILDQVLSQVREGDPSADELRSMCDLLSKRLAVLEEDLVEVPESAPERTALARRVGALRRQVAALREEAAITEFVEESTVAAYRMAQGAGY